jgi:myxalamid-type polyketide synthase MxaB
MVGNALYRKVVRGSIDQPTVDLGALATLPAAERRTAINEAVRARVAALLHFDDVSDISPHARFSELGFDSLTAVELKNALESTFGASLPTSVVFDYPTVAHLAEFLDGELAHPTGADVPAADEVEMVRALPGADLDAELAALRSL